MRHSDHDDIDGIWNVDEKLFFDHGGGLDEKMSDIPKGSAFP